MSKSTTRTRLGLEPLDRRDVPATLVSVAAADAVGSEAGSDGLSFAVTRTGDNLDRCLWARLAWSGTASCADATGGTYWVHFAPDQTVANVNLSPVDDALVEGDETIELAVASAWGYDPTGPAAFATIRDNDTPAPVPAPTPAKQLPVLMVIANQDFYYREYSETRAELEAGGLTVQVAAAALDWCIPHGGSGQGADGGFVMPDLAITAAQAADYSAIVFVGGWGASSYQYAFQGTYSNAAYNGSPAVEAATNALIGDFVGQDKYVAAICHGVSVLAWARVDGVSPVAGKTVSAYGLSSPDFAGATGGELTTRWHVEANGATMVASGSVGVAGTAADDVVVDGKIITAENYDSATAFGRTIARELTK